MYQPVSNKDVKMPSLCDMLKYNEANNLDFLEDDNNENSVYDLEDDGFVESLDFDD